MDIVKRIFIFIFSGGSLTYLGYLFQSNTIIIQEGLDNTWNMGSYGIIAAIFLYLLFFFSIRPSYFKKSKFINIILGIILIFLGNKILTNNVEQQLYVGDIITVLGVILTLIGGTNLLVLNTVKQKKEEAEMEIIEV